MNIFTRCILRSLDEADYSELKAKELVSFLIDKCMEVFRVPDELTTAIEQTIVSCHRLNNVVLN